MNTTVNNAHFPETSIQLQHAHEPLFSKFEELPAEVIGEIFAQMDSPTQSSFSWVCRKYYQIYFDPDFDTYEFGQACAKLGYETLLLYCIELGASNLVNSTRLTIHRKPDRYHRDFLSATAAGYGHFFERIYDKYEQTSHLAYEPHQSSAISSMILAASIGGHGQLVNKLKLKEPMEEQYSKIERIHLSLMGGHLDLAEQAFEELTKAERKNFSREQFIESIFDAGLEHNLPELFFSCMQTESLFV